MDFGALMFFTDYAISAIDLAKALEERGFESVWAPEHSHIPTSRKTPFPGGGELPKRYYDAMDPFVSLTAAAVATTKLKVGTGVCSSATRSRRPSSSPRSIKCRTAAFSLVSAAAGTRTKWRTTAPSSRLASS
jgi:hypothetical protein